MVVLGFVWLALLIWELLNSLSHMLEAIGLVIWILFLVKFAIEFVLAPRKRAYMRTNCLTALRFFFPHSACCG